MTANIASLKAQADHEVGKTAGRFRAFQARGSPVERWHREPKAIGLNRMLMVAAGQLNRKGSNAGQLVTINEKGALGFSPTAPILVAGAGFEPATFGL